MQNEQEKTLIPYEDAVEGIGIVAQEVNHWKNAFAHLRDEYPDSSAYREMAERYGMYAAALNTAMAVIQTQNEPARLMTAEDWQNNPNVDALGFLPCWVEYSQAARDKIQEQCGMDYEPDGWNSCDEKELEDRTMRTWSARPTKEQMEAIPWG